LKSNTGEKETDKNLLWDELNIQRRGRVSQEKSTTRYVRVFLNARTSTRQKETEGRKIDPRKGNNDDYQIQTMYTLPKCQVAGRRKESSE
jgi:hypothetical protein